MVQSQNYGKMQPAPVGSPEWEEQQQRIRDDKLKEAENAMAIKNTGRPDRPEWESLLGDNGMIAEQYQLGNNLNTGFLDQMRQDNLRGPGEQSQWRQLMEQNVQRQAGEASANTQAQGLNAMSNAAMMGGLRAGSAERMASSFGNRAALAQQNMLGNRLNLDVQDEQMRTQGLMNLGNAEMQTANYERAGDQFNIQNTLNENLQKRAESTNAYNEQMRAWAAEKTAAATPSGGGGKK